MGNDPKDASGWDESWITAVGSNIFAASDHDGYFPEPEKFTADALTQSVKAPRDRFIPKLLQRRKTLDQHGGEHIKISADEWGLGPPWAVEGNFSVAHAIYAASFLASCSRAIAAANMGFVNYFEPINEGAIFVGKFSSSSLTPVGDVLRLYGTYAGRALLNSSQNENVDVLAAIKGNVVTLTVVNLNAEVDIGLQNLVLAPAPPAQSIEIVQLLPSGYGRASVFSRKTYSAGIGSDGVFEFALPAFSVLQATVVL